MSETYLLVNIDGQQHRMYVDDKQLRKVIVRLNEQEESRQTVDRLLSDSKPDTLYYEFPGGVEVRQISAHLMSFPSQILQYASRSGRVDGNCKSEDVADKIRDFEKIIDFARWEIERLEGTK